MENKIVIVIIAVILFFGIIFVWTYASYQPGVLLSCEEGGFVKFVNIGTPMKIVFMEGYCSGKIQITSYNGEEVCNIDDYNSEDDKIVAIRCSNLKHFKNQNLTINFWTYSVDYGNHSGVEIVSYSKNG